MNIKIKFRESFRPFGSGGPAVGSAQLVRAGAGSGKSVHAPGRAVLEQHRIPLNEQDAQTMSDDLDLRNRVNVARSTIPAVTHVDYSARVQTVDEGRIRGLRS